jgi:hypothetical protein
MIKLRLAVVALIVAGLASPSIGATTKSYKHSSKHSSMMKKEPNAKPGTTTGANTKPSSAKSTQGSNGTSMQEKQ